MSIDQEKKKVVLANELVSGVVATAALGLGVVLHLPLIAVVGTAAPQSTEACGFCFHRRFVIPRRPTPSRGS